MKDKNGTELNIGDQVHYYREERTLRTSGRPPKQLPRRDIIFTIDQFRDNPMPTNRRRPGDDTWIGGEDFVTFSFRDGQEVRNFVSPLSVVKMDENYKHPNKKNKYSDNKLRHKFL